MFGIDVLNAAAKKMRRDGGGDATAAMTMKGSSIRNKRVHHATSAKHGSVLDMKFDIPAELMRGAVGGSSEE